MVQEKMNKKNTQNMGNFDLSKKEMDCPKCRIKLRGYKPIKKGTGCEWCEPRCSYCNKYLKGFQLDHLNDCKVFQKIK